MRVHIMSVFFAALMLGVCLAFVSAIKSSGFVGVFVGWVGLAAAMGVNYAIEKAQR